MKTAICAIIKDEHRFLEEWIEWHLGLGFDAIHLFEDKGSKSHEEICAKYSNVYLRRYENDNKVQELLSANGSSSRQLVLYEWFGNTYQGIYDWVAFIDLDEFITFNDDCSLNTLCEEFEEYSCVLLSWRFMGASGHIKRPSCGVVDAYTQEEPPMQGELGYMHKSFCNLNKWQGFTSSLHRAKCFVNTNHNANKSELCYDKAWINHYFTKSWEDWCDRIFKRGDTQNGHRLLCDFFDANPSMKKYEKDLVESVSEMIPNGTYRLSHNNNLIAGGNVNRIKKLNGEKTIKPVDMLNKRILLIGNKPMRRLTDEQIAQINSYDVVVRVNGMNNIEQTGGRVDWWWLNVWNWEKIKENLGSTKYDNVDIIMVDEDSKRLVNERSLYMNLPKMKTDKTLIYTGQKSTCLYDQEDYWTVDKSGTVPTTSIVCLSYLLNKYIFSEITLCCFDIDEREKLFKTHSNWRDTWHKNVGGHESDYINDKVAKGELKILEL